MCRVKQCPAHGSFCGLTCASLGQQLHRGPCQRQAAADLVALHVLIIKKVVNPFLPKVGARDVFAIEGMNLGVCEVDEAFPVTCHPTWKK